MHCFGTNDNRSLFTNIVKASQWGAMDNDEELEPPDSLSTPRDFVNEMNGRICPHFVTLRRKERSLDTEAGQRSSSRLGNHQWLQAPKYGWKNSKYLWSLAGNT